MEKSSRIFIAGHNGLVGSSIYRLLSQQGYTNILVRNRNELDLFRKEDVEKFFMESQPEYIFLAAAKVGGIMDNSRFPVDYLQENLLIQNNIISLSYKYNIKKLLFLGSSCIYPKFCNQPIKESSLMSGKFEPTNESYAIAKIAGIKLCQAYNRQYNTNYIACMPTNLYGPGDNFDLQSSHVLPALIRKFHEAKHNHEVEVVLWGDGTAKREFLHVNDMASACVFIINTIDAPMLEEKIGENFLNVGTGIDLSIQELATIIREVIGFDGIIRWDTSKPNGTPRKLLDVSFIQSLGWHHKIELIDGIKETYKWYLQQLH